MPTPTATIFLPYSALDAVILRGARAAQPAASAVVPGTLYCVTDEGAPVERSNGTTWQVYSPTPGGSGTGTGDVVGPGVATDQAIALYDGTTGKLIQDSATTIPALTASIESSVTASVIPVDLATETTGTLPDARLSANVQLKPIAATDLPAHATRHQPGGADALAVDAAAATGSLRTLGTGAQQAAPGNDARFGAPTAPLAHHTTHEPGGADALAALSAAILTSGTLPDARLSANVQLKPIAATDLPAHATRHQPGGADALAVDAAAATGSLRTLGTGAQQAAPGNDARFGAPTAPLAHHTTHEPGGADALAALSAAILTSGTLPDARLSANVPRLNASNVFTADQQEFQTALYFPMRLRNVAGVANQRVWNVAVLAGGDYYLQPADDSGTGQIAEALQATRAGDVKAFRDLYEKNRVTPLGHWIAVPYSAANFTANAGTWTVDAGDMQTCAYTLVGKTMWLSFYLTATSVVAPLPSELRIALPGGVTAALLTVAGGVSVYDGSAYRVGYLVTAQGDAFVRLRLDPGAAATWPATTNLTNVGGTVCIPLT